VPRPEPSSARREGSGQRLGVFGGTFDPPHVGHLVTAVNVRHALGLDRVLLIPAGSPWQKVGTRPISPARDRLAMVEAAVHGVEGLEACPIEVERSESARAGGVAGPSYTVDTLLDLARVHPGAEFFLILGSDAAAGLETWERPEEAVRLARFVVVDRPGASPPLPELTDWIRVEVPHLEVSSTDLRSRFVDGRPLDFLVPPAVLDVARRRGLYSTVDR